MKIKYFLYFLFLLSSCGGGSSGTAIGGAGDGPNFSGQILSRTGEVLANTEITILNTEDKTLSDDAGSFDLNASELVTNPTIQITTPEGEQASLTLDSSSLDITDNQIDLSLIYDSQTNAIKLAELTLNARMIRSCGQFFINTQTIKQISPITEGFICTIEAEFKENAIPKNEIIFNLEHKSCDPDDSWKFITAGKTGTSGDGVGEISFEFKNDEQHCLYRITGPVDETTEYQLSVQVDTLRKK